MIIHANEARDISGKKKIFEHINNCIVKSAEQGGRVCSADFYGADAIAADRFNAEIIDILESKGYKTNYYFDNDSRNNRYLFADNRKHLLKDEQVFARLDIKW